MKYSDALLLQVKNVTVCIREFFFHVTHANGRNDLYIYIIHVFAFVQCRHQKYENEFCCLFLIGELGV